jgi:CRP-like cAMP-binding protein
MADQPQGGEIRNKILARLSPSDLRLLEPNLMIVDLPFRKALEARNRRIEYVYFIHAGFASVVAGSQNLHNTEVGMIGVEGLTGLPVVLGTDRSPHETYIQLAGYGSRIAAAHLRTAMDESATLRRALLRYAHSFLTQVTYTALSNGRSKLEERLARWLLMAHDRSTGDELILTHELLALMLGVRRPGVTTALSLLEDKGLINPRRGAISISDREGLKLAANGAYGAPEAEFQRLFD